MEYDAYCRIRMKDLNQLGLAKQLIEADENAPLFENEVEPELRQMFNALEDIPVAKSITVDEDSLLITLRWFTGYSDEIETAIKGLAKSGVASYCALVFSDEGGVDGFAQIGDELRRLTQWKGKPLTKIGGRKNIFRLLEQIEKQELKART